MFGAGYRTPTKTGLVVENPHLQKQEGATNNEVVATVRSGTLVRTDSLTNVRRSILDIEEASQSDLQSSQIKNDHAGPSKKGTGAMSQKGNDIIIQNTMTEAASSPNIKESKLKGRVYEAKACLVKAKLQLKNSRNLKAEIKTVVTEALDRLYQLVKEAEAAKPSIPSTTGGDAVTQEANNGWQDAIKEQSFLIKKSLEDTEAIKSELKQQGERIAAAALDIGSVREQTSHIKSVVDKYKILDGISYATMAASKKTNEHSATKLQSVHSVVVSSADTHDTSEDVLSKIRTAVSARTTGIRVDRLRKARDQKVVLGCRSREEMTKVMDRLKADSPTLQVKEMENRDPLVIMLGVLNFNTDEEILGALKRQNGHVLGTIPEEDYRASVKFRRKARNPLESHVVLQVSPLVWQRLTEEGKAHIDLQRVVVKDQSPLITCSRCLGYGHGRKACQEIADTCSHCAGTHLRSACPAWQAGEKPTCRNCQSARLDRTDHNSSDGECPIRKKWDALARARVAYC